MKGADHAHGVWVALSVSACRFCCGRGQENLGAKVQKKTRVAVLSLADNKFFNLLSWPIRREMLADLPN